MKKNFRMFLFGYAILSSMNGCQPAGLHNRSINTLTLPSGAQLKVYVLDEEWMEYREGTLFGSNSEVKGTLIIYRGNCVHRIIHMHPFAVDLVGIKDDGKMVYVEKEITPGKMTGGAGSQSLEPCGRYGLYIAGTEFDKLGLKLGDKIQW